ncbi:MAG: hypothetical protein ACHQWU_00380 [Gemmatimonadales bacterium]
MFVALFAFAALQLAGPPDSVRLLRAAHEAQFSFEAFRRAHLPPGDTYTGPCDVTVGRYCYWRGDGSDDRPPPPDRPEVQQRRDALISQLDSASVALPGDAWLAGQHVRYLVEAGRTDDALRFALRECRAGAAWCDALGGYAAQEADRFALADSAFSAALAAMGDAERCRWLDVSVDLDGPLADRFGKTPCDRRQAFVRRLFWLGAPLLSVSGTDLFTEHLARMTRARIAEHAATTDGDAWRDDARELALRYGFTRWYSRAEPAYGSLRDAAYVGHDASLPFYFLPGPRALDSLGSLSSDDWQLDDARAPMGYAPDYAHTIHDLPAQIAAFRRGESTLVLAAWDARRDTSLLGRPLDAALVLAASPDSMSIARRAASAKGQMSVEARLDSGLVSVELLATGNKHAARRRIGLPARAAGDRSARDDARRRTRQRVDERGGGAVAADRRVLGDVRLAPYGRNGALHTSGRAGRRWLAAARGRANASRRPGNEHACAVARGAAAKRGHRPAQRTARPDAPAQRPLQDGAHGERGRRSAGELDPRDRGAVAPAVWAGVALAPRGARQAAK